jgi:hypothetical protein
MEHHLNIWPAYFEAVKDGSKTFEARVNDRGFQRGDTVKLREFIVGTPEIVGGYTQRELDFEIGYVLPIDAERVVFSLLPLPQKGPKS